MLRHEQRRFRRPFGSFARRGDESTPAPGMKVAFARTFPGETLMARCKRNSLRATIALLATLLSVKGFALAEPRISSATLALSERLVDSSTSLETPGTSVDLADPDRLESPSS